MAQVVQTTPNGGTSGSGTAYTNTFSLICRPGSTIVVLVETAAGSAATSVADNQSGGSNTYVQKGSTQTNGSGNSLQAFVAKNIGGGSALTITATWGSAPTLPFVWAWEVTGADLTNPVNTTAGAVGSGTTATTASFNIAEQGDLVLTGATLFSTGNTWTKQSGYLLDSAAIQTAGQAGGTGGAQHAIASGAFTGVTSQMTSSVSVAWCIIALVIKPAQVPSSFTYNLVFDGDSITEGYNVSTVWTSSLSLNAGPWCITNQGVPSEFLSGMRTNASLQIDPLIVAGAHNVIVVWGGTNDINAGTSVATVESTLSGYCADRTAAGWNKVIIVPMISRPTWDASKDTYNAWMVSNFNTFCDALVTLSSNLVADGAYSNLTYFQADQIHPTQLSDTTLIAPAVSTAINSLFPSTSGGFNQLMLMGCGT